MWAETLYVVTLSGPEEATPPSPPLSVHRQILAAFTERADAEAFVRAQATVFYRVSESALWNMIGQVVDVELDMTCHEYNLGWRSYVTPGSLSPDLYEIRVVTYDIFEIPWNPLIAAWATEPGPRRPVSLVRP